VHSKGIGRPRGSIAQDSVLNAYSTFRSVAAAARSLNISKGTCWQRLKEVGITPLGMSRSEAGQLGAKAKGLNNNG